MKVIMIKGLPNSNKTEVAEKLGCKIIHPFLYAQKQYSGKRFKRERIFDFVSEMLYKLKNDGEGLVVILGRHLNPIYEKRYREICKELDCEFSVKEIEKNPLECIDGNNREEVMSLYLRYYRPEIPWSPEKMEAIICDIDGTLAHRNNRSPYDFSNVSNDDVDEEIRFLINILYQSGLHIIIVSGREDSCREETIKWLQDNNVNYHELLMRSRGDKRRDWLIKKEIFEQFIKPYYNVELVIDDRNQVVDMWRSLGLKCLQVGYGNF